MHSGMKLVKEDIPDNELDKLNGGGLKIKNANAKGYLVAQNGDGVDISGRMETHRGTVQKGMSLTLKTQMDVGVCVEDEE